MHKQSCRKSLRRSPRSKPNSTGAARPAALEEEAGDLLFAVANLARKLGVEPETALRRATAKFERRFRALEVLAKDRSIGRDLEALETLWGQVKTAENGSGGS